jgi:uncharacterized membrane protein YedE/YeeE
MNKPLALLFGMCFGFLLQKGGVGSYDVLMGQLLLQDWTVAQVMLSAILVGMLGLFTLLALGKIELKLKKTRLAANIAGGLIFGVGFALSGYCPGSAAAALGEGHWDALFAMTGMVLGSYVYAVLSGPLSETVEKWGDLGKITLAQLTGQPLSRFVPVFSGFLLLILTVLSVLTN